MGSCKFRRVSDILMGAANKPIADLLQAVLD